MELSEEFSLLLPLCLCAFVVESALLTRLDHRVGDPAGVARSAQVDQPGLVDLVDELLLGLAAELGEELGDLARDVAGEVFLGDERRAGVGDGDDPYREEIPLARRQGRGAAGTGDGGRVGHEAHDSKMVATPCPWPTHMVARP